MTILRQAFNAMVKDPEFLADIQKTNVELDPLPGEKVQELWAVNLPKDGGEYKLKRLEDINLTKTDCQAYFLALKQAYELNQLFEWRIKS